MIVFMNKKHLPYLPANKMTLNINTLSPFLLSEKYLYSMFKQQSRAEPR